MSAREVALTSRSRTPARHPRGPRAYGDFVAWRDKHPEEYEAAYQALKDRAMRGDR